MKKEPKKNNCWKKVGTFGSEFIEKKGDMYRLVNINGKVTFTFKDD